MLNIGRFSFRVFPTVVTLLAILLLVKLGFWQLDRAAEKQALFDDFAASELSQQPDILALDLERLPPRYTEVSASGQFDTERYFLRDNQMLHGKVGYHVIALLQLADGQYLPVNIGWLPAPVSRTELPETSLPEGDVELTGLLHYPDQSAFQLAEQDWSTVSWPWRIQQFEFEPIRAATGLPILPVMVLLAESSENTNNDTDWGLARQWEPQVMTPEKHQGYAVQWFLLAVACAVVFLFASRRQLPSNEE